MPIQFENPIVNKRNTVNFQRQLLHGLITNKINLQRTIGKHKREFFTNNSRLFIYDCIIVIFNNNRSLLTPNQFDFELQKKFDAEKDKLKIEDYKTEYENIIKTTQTDDIDVIIKELNEEQMHQNIGSLVYNFYNSYAHMEEKNMSNKEVLNELQCKINRLLNNQTEEGRIINLHKDSDDWFEEVKRRKEHPEIYAGVPTGFEKFDKLTGGLFPAELTVVFGLSGKGKSTFMKALSCNIRKQGRVVLHCGNEENEFQMRSKYMSADSGEKYAPFKKGKYEEEDFKRLKEFSDQARNTGDIYIYEFPQQTDATWIERAYRNLEMQNIHVDVIVIDYLDLMKPIEKAYSENDEQGKITSDLKQLAINCHCPVITATQAGTQSEKQERKANPFLTAADVFGTKRKVHSANTLIGIVNQTATVDVDENGHRKSVHHMVLCVPKNRDGEVFTFRQIMDASCGRFYEDDDKNNAMLNNLENQAQAMISENKNEIDAKEIIQAQNDSLQNKVDQLRESLNEEKDDFLSDAPDAENNEKKETVMETPKEDDSFLTEAPDYNDSSNSDNDLSNMDKTTQETPESQSEVPENKKLSETIPHKLSLSEILKNKSKK